MVHSLTNSAWAKRLRTKSVAALFTLENRLDSIVIGWLALAGLVCALRLIASPLPFATLGLDAVLPYALLVIAPAASVVLALRWFADGADQPQPATRLALIGRWRSVDPREARRHKLYGTTGLMVSLLIGMLLNIPVRAMEFLAAMPPIPAASPHWLGTLQFALTLDVVLFTSLYGIAFVAALRKVPLFPRLLLTIWVLDIAMQVLVAKMVVPTGLPVEVATSLETLLMGNIKKVMISAGLWLPYLILSTRVNVTYRSRVPA